ncbi:cysteine desulfurase family protein [Salinicoccus roseus]|uniref:cysteine desulfurase n=1 Tax=Salinicoccus roseus TaxID=45670 RepID=A0A265E9G1_9STAP|nr:cysteine desulfurase family protein [Salinicoccus roseus]OZT78222.1 aminotransferase [Salinicoccus roseus]RPE54304.1 cysteine desulfurase [Salinicoccus roseus]GGA66529.1 putative cysteine desulfurase IscS 1 [Salinicoccus roseus]
MEVYADYAATTPVDRDILKNIIDNADEFGNPSSIHKAGKRAKAQLEKARRQTAALLNASASEIIFTSGATEANNMAIRGVIGRRDRPHVITTEVEHASVLNTFRALEADAEVTYVPADERGVVDMAALKRALREDTALVSIMLVNNETGVMQPIYEIREMLSGSDALLHVDAVQAFGHMTVDVEDLGVDLLSLSAHKLYGPKGVGLLYKSKDVHLDPVITGGSQERDARGGTENTMWIQAMAAAMQKASDEMTRRSIREMQLKELLLNTLTSAEIPFQVNGDVNQSASHIINLYFPWTDAEFLLTALDMAGICLSAGSACHAGTLEPSHVLSSMYGETDRSTKSIRFSFSYMMTDEEIERIAEALGDIYERLMN